MQRIHDRHRRAVGQRHPKRNSLDRKPIQKRTIKPIHKGDATLPRAVQTHALYPLGGVKAFQLVERIVPRAGHPLEAEGIAGPAGQRLVAPDGADGLALEVIDHGPVHTVALHLFKQPIRIGKRRGPVVTMSHPHIGIKHGHPRLKVQGSHTLTSLAMDVSQTKSPTFESHLNPIVSNAFVRADCVLFLYNKLHDFFGVLKESLKVIFRTCPFEG